MIFCVEVLAIYENPGTTPNAARINQRNTDFTDGSAAAGQFGHAVAPQANEYLARFGQPGDEDGATSRYGFGWRARQWLSTKADADSIGNTIWTRLSGRSLKDGSKVEVFSRDETAPGCVTGPATFRRALPAGSDVG